MLHASTRDTLDLGEVGTLLLQSLQDKINGLEPECDWRKDFTLVRVGEHTFLNAIFGEVGIKVDLCLMDELQVRTDNDSLQSRVTSVRVTLLGGVAPAG